MSEEQVVKLLEEIRDLQKQHVENDKAALRNQEASIKIAQEAVERHRGAVRSLRWVLALLGLVFVISFFQWFFGAH